jgi:uncharacterized alpha-E superfamily protein
VAFQAGNPSSIVRCIGHVRENSRTIRDRISREMWEDVNGLYHRVSRFRPAEEIAAGPHRFCNVIKFASHRFHGVSDDTLPRDEGWHFLQAGRALERAEMTARIVDVEYQKLYEGLADGSQPDNYQWMAELLILHRQHPRSIRFNIATLQQSLRAISGSGAGSYANEAERLTGKLHETLMYDRIEEIFAHGLHSFLVDLQKTCRAIGEHIARTYFYCAVVA